MYPFKSGASKRVVHGVKLLITPFAAIESPNVFGAPFKPAGLDRGLLNLKQNHERGGAMEQKKILAAVDGSHHSLKVLDKTIEFSRFYQAEVILVYCHKKFPSILGNPYKEEAITKTLYEAEELIKPYVSKLEEADVQVSVRLMEEPAGTVIPNVAEIEKCEMIIMGSRGLTDLEGLIVGSVTHRVLHTATCPVLVVR